MSTIPEKRAVLSEGVADPRRSSRPLTPITLRLRAAVWVILLLAAVYWLVIRPWMTSWGATPAEQQQALPGDHLFPAGARLVTKAIRIDAPPEVVWGWLVQVGQGRAGFYSYTWLENLFGIDIYNADAIHPEWQSLAVGDAWRLTPADYLWGVGKDAASPVVYLEPGRVLVSEVFGAYVLEPRGEQATRLLVRNQAGSGNLLMGMVVEPLVFTLERRMLLGLKARAEGRPDAPPVLMALAVLGWVAAGIGLLVLFLVHRRWRAWLALPVAAALPALLMSADPQAALAAFNAAAITVLGFLRFGRHWWGDYLVIGAVVLLTLLLAPEAYTTLGLTFAAVVVGLAAIRLGSRRYSRAPVAGAA